MTGCGGISCRELVELVSDYIEGTLAPDVRERLETHLRTCRGCTEYVEEMRTTVRLASVAALEQRPDRAALLEAFRRFRTS
jgi:anti-sigma factor RsiW